MAKAVADNTTIARRSVLKGLAAVPIAATAAHAAGAAELAEADPIARLLQERQAIYDVMDRPGSDLCDDDALWADVDRIQRQLIGMPVTTRAGAYAAAQAVLKHLGDYFNAEVYIAEAVDMSLLSETVDFLRSFQS